MYNYDLSMLIIKGAYPHVEIIPYFLQRNPRLYRNITQEYKIGNEAMARQVATIEKQTKQTGTSVEYTKKGIKWLCEGQSKMEEGLGKGMQQLCQNQEEIKSMIKRR